jgi:ABC-type nitrate/sulfonate/bicarbonate transport system ATPase subunit
MTQASAVEFKGVNLRFYRGQSTVQVLTDLSFAVESGEFLSIIGPSGCGKSSILNLIAGFIEPTSGQILIDGQDRDLARVNVGVVFQEYLLFPWLTVAQNIGFGLSQSFENESHKDRVVEDHVHLMGLEGFENSYPNELSGGMKQRVALARALAYSPSILLMDEPFASLDAYTRYSMQELLLDIWRTKQKTIVFVTHDVDEAFRLANRILILSARPGRVREVLKIRGSDQATADSIVLDSGQRERIFKLMGE